MDKTERCLFVTGARNRMENEELENTCCTCYWRDIKSGFCYNYLSPKGTENTDPNDTCEVYERKSEYDDETP